MFESRQGRQFFDGLREVSSPLPRFVIVPCGAQFAGRETANFARVCDCLRRPYPVPHGPEHDKTIGAVEPLRRCEKKAPDLSGAYRQK